MNKSAGTISKKAGLPPGVLMHVGKRKADEVQISVIDYNVTEFIEFECKTPEESFQFRDKESITWINVNGLHDTAIIGALGQHFGLHPLLLEDVLNTRHRPKMEEFDDCLFLMLKMLSLSEDGNTLISEQVSFVLGKNWVISFQEQPGDVFDTIRQRLRESKGNIRRRGGDYLVYRLLDTVVDNYFVVTEKISDNTEQLEETVLKSSEIETLHEIQGLKKQLMSIRKAVTPLREVVSALQKDDAQFIQAGTTRYLHDVYEHIIQVSESIETQRDLLASIMDLYLSGISNRMNQVMQVLTIIATIFIPLTFVAGIYGMNFDNIPELHWKYGYFAVWGAFLAVGVVMVLYFRRKKWL